MPPLLKENSDGPVGMSALPSRAGIYLGMRYGLGILVSFGNMLVMTRWIGPHAYGLFVTALGLTSFLAALTRGGFDTYLVRAESAPDRRTYDMASTAIAILSLVLLAAGAAVTPLLSLWYRSREFALPYLVTLLTVPLAGLSGPPTAKLERDLNFRVIAGIELGGQVLALLVAATLAWFGLGVWAPVTGLLVWQAWAAVGAMRAAQLWPHPAFDQSQARAMLSFGAGYSASMRVWQLRTLVNPLMVGRFAGAEGVAFVGLAIRIAEGLGFVRAAAGRLAIAALSRVREDSSKLRDALEGALRIQVLALGPLLCLFAVVAPVLVPRALGARWMPSMRVYPFVAAGVLINSLYNLQASALFVAGRQWVVLRSYLAQMGLLVLCSFVLVPRVGIRGYGWAELVACAAYAILHVGLRPVVSLSYERVLPVLLAFLAPPFALLVGTKLTPIFWLPLLALSSVSAWKWARPHEKRNAGEFAMSQLRARWSRIA